MSISRLELSIATKNNTPTIGLIHVFSDGIVYPRRRSCVLGQDRVFGEGSCICGGDCVVNNWPLTSSANTHQPCYTGLCLQKLIFLPLFTKAAFVVVHWPLLTKAGHVSYGLRCTWREGPWGFRGLCGEGPRGCSDCQYPLRIVDGSNETGSGSGTV